jgi:hypothetical protein
MVQKGSDDQFCGAEPTLTIQYIERTLERARKHIENSHLDDALTMLHDLEKRFFEGSRLFDLLGEVLLRQGKIDEGIRYRALYQELKNTLASAGKRGRFYPLGAGICQGQETTQAEEGSSRVHAAALGEPCHQAPAQASFTPLTAAMGHELMRQGHCDRALAIFDMLVERNPGDEKLKEARDQARARLGGQHALTTLSRWLENIENMKAVRSTEA